MSDHKTKLIHSQAAEDKLEEIIKQRFGDLPADEAHLALPLFQNPMHAIFHSALPSLSSQEVVEMQVKSRYFRWVNRGRMIGVEINEDCSNDMLKHKQEAERILVEVKRILVEALKFKRRLQELKLLAKDKERIDLIKSELKESEEAISRTRKSKSFIEEILTDANNRLGQIEQILATGDNFIAVTTMPETVSFNPKKVTLTYSFPSSYKRGDVTAMNPNPLLMDCIRQSLADNPYIHFVEIDEEKAGIKASIQIVQTLSLVSDKDGVVETGHAQLYDAFDAQPVPIVLAAQLHTKDSMSYFLHELMHALGLPHPWDALAAKDETGKFKGELKSSNALTREIEDFRKNKKTPFVQTLPDSSNEAYTWLRKINNQDLRALSQAVLSTLYHVEDPYPKGVVFKFVPERAQENITIDHNGFVSVQSTYEELKKKQFYSKKTTNQEDGSQVVTYGGHCAGMTISNPGADFTDLDFRDIPSFPESISGFPSGLRQQMVYTSGVTGYFGPDGNITFYTYRPSIKDYPGVDPVLYQRSIADHSPSDKNVSIDLLTRNLRNIYLSPHNDSAIISKIYKNVEVYPGTGNDVVRVLGRNTTVIVGKNEGCDSLDFEKGGTVALDYKQDELHYYQKDNDVYLISSQSDAAKGVHGVCLRNYKKNNYADSVVVQDSSRKAMDLKNKQFAALPSTINFGS